MIGPCIVCNGPGGGTPAPVPLCSSPQCVTRFIAGMKRAELERGLRGAVRLIAAKLRNRGSA